MLGLVEKHLPRFKSSRPNDGGRDRNPISWLTLIDAGTLYWAVCVCCASDEAERCQNPALTLYYTMSRLRSYFRSAKAETSRSQGTTTNVVTSSTINNARGDQYITNNVYPGAPAPLAGASSAPPIGQTPFNDAPIDYLSIHFTGRKRELALIAKAFEQRRDVPLRCALHGNQGVGKSQLTYFWAKSTFARKENVYIMWISATTVEKLIQGFFRLLLFVDHPDRSHPDQGVRLAAARRWLEEIDTGNWLLVIDNVFPETLDFLRQHLPRGNGRGTILFTTRTQAVADAVTSTAGERHEVIEVPLLDVKAGVELFCGQFDSGKMDPASPKIEAIVTAVGRLPLAISHIAGYMKETRISLDDMLELYQGEHKFDVSLCYMTPDCNRAHFAFGRL